MTLKTILLFSSFYFSLAVYSQDTVKLKQIDAVVNQINTSNFKTERDTIRNDQPKIGLSMRTYLTMLIDGSELKKYVNEAHVTTQETGTVKQMASTNTFYFDHKKLIKLEEFVEKDDKRIDAHWYFADDKPIHYTHKYDNAEKRAELLLTIAKSILEKVSIQ